MSRFEDIHDIGTAGANLRQYIHWCTQQSNMYKSITIERIVRNKNGTTFKDINKRCRIKRLTK